MAAIASPTCAADKQAAQDAMNRFALRDMFDLEVASDPQISPDGTAVAFVRNFSDIMKDRKRSNLWIVDYEGKELQPLTSGSENDSSPRWSPDGKRLLYASSTEGATQVYVRWMDSGQTAKVTSVPKPPESMTWSPDGKWIAFAMLVSEKAKPFAELPAKPEGAEWGVPPKVIQKITYRHDGEGFVEDGYTQIFVVPAEGGTPRQLTHGSFQHAGYWSMEAPSKPLAWTPDGVAILFSANRHDDWEYNPVNTEIYEVSFKDGAVHALTDRKGPDTSPALSPDGKLIAYVGFDDRLQGYQVNRLYLMNRDGSNSRVLIGDLDRDVRDPTWSSDGQGIFFQYDDQGNTRIAFATLDGKVRVLAEDLGGVSHGRPYEGGSFSVAHSGRFAYTQTQPSFPSDVAVGQMGAAEVKRVTHLNEDLFGHKELGSVEPFWCESSCDQRPIQGWVVKPPGFDPGKKYPMILEIHGGPFANYGDRFSSEIQLYAAAGYLVTYVNPRGSTSYGEEFGNLIHHNFPGQDYDDLMSAVDAVVAKGFVDSDHLYVTGGSAGGVLTSWIVGKTNRFRAAVAVKPIINWTSFILTSDDYIYFTRYWFAGFPWDHPGDYAKRSPLSLVGHVQTPTMLITGEADQRTPISESEQFYQALKLRKVDTALVRLPDASHGMGGRPTQLIGKVAHILKWFEKYQQDPGQTR